MVDIRYTLTFTWVLILQDEIAYRYFLCDIYEVLTRRLLEASSEDNIFLSQPCRDNTLYLLKLIDEMLISEFDLKLPFPPSSSDVSPESFELESHKLSSCLYETLPSNDLTPK